MAKDTQQEKSANTDQTISDVIRGMQHAVITAQEVLQDHQFRLIESTPYLIFQGITSYIIS